MDENWTPVQLFQLQRWEKQHIVGQSGSMTVFSGFNRAEVLATIDAHPEVAAADRWDCFNALLVMEQAARAVLNERSRP